MWCVGEVDEVRARVFGVTSCTNENLLGVTRYLAPPAPSKGSPQCGSSPGNSHSVPGAGRTARKECECQPLA
mgnify:CR=1 FL=1